MNQRGTGATVTLLADQARLIVEECANSNPTPHDVEMVRRIHRNHFS